MNGWLSLQAAQEQQLLNDEANVSKQWIYVATLCDIATTVRGFVADVLQFGQCLLGISSEVPTLLV